jgi:hypothetical protein
VCAWFLREARERAREGGREGKVGIKEMAQALAEAIVKKILVRPGEGGKKNLFHSVCKALIAQVCPPSLPPSLLPFPLLYKQFLTLTYPGAPALLASLPPSLPPISSTTSHHDPSSSLPPSLPSRARLP